MRDGAALFSAVQQLVIVPLPLHLVLWGTMRRILLPPLTGCSVCFGLISVNLGIQSVCFDGFPQGVYGAYGEHTEVRGVEDNTLYKQNNDKFTEHTDSTRVC